MTTKLSRNETLKEQSNFLRGTIAEGLRERISGAVSEDDTWPACASPAAR
jgi:sulfite reductase (NADPH) hemoprotein beta-component